MPISELLKQAKKFDIQLYSKPKNAKELTKSHVPFTGSPLRHPIDDKKLLLVADPYSSNTFYYEFWRDDVSHAEELTSIVNMEGVTIIMSRLWVKKDSIALRCTPFVVQDIRTGRREER